jgi:hypothetical protein
MPRHRSPRPTAPVKPGKTRPCPRCHDGATEQVAEGLEKASRTASVWRCRADARHTELIGLMACRGCGGPAADYISPTCALCIPCRQDVATFDEESLEDLFDGWRVPVTNLVEQRTIRVHCQRNARKRID